MRIRTRSVAVEIELGSAARLKGEVFLHDVSGAHAGGETIVDLLNEPSPFFPLRLSPPDPQTLLVAKAHVRFMFVPPLATDERIAELRRGSARLELVFDVGGDEVLSGVLYADCPPPNVRALDVLNATAERFLVLVQEGKDCLVGRSHIRHVRDHDPAIDRPLALEHFGRKT